MVRFKQSLATFVGLIGLVSIIGLVMPSSGRGQGNSTNVPPASDVNIVNTSTNPALVRDVDRPPAQPYQDTVHITFTETSSGSGEFNAVPSGKRLVVEHASAEVNTAGGQMATVTLINGGVRYSVPMIFQGVYGEHGTPRGINVASEPVRLYVDAGQSLGVEVRTTESFDVSLARVSISGHLVNVP